jgi:hypothetical protein
MGLHIGWGRKLRILDFDCENRPLSYLGSDFTTPELTAVAYQFVGEKGSDDVWVLGEDTLLSMLHGFREVWNQAGLATGHNIRKHDLPLLNAMMLEAGLPPLHPKLVCDTWADLKRRSPGFASQATLAAMLGVKAPKIAMSTVTWRAANRLSAKGIEATRKRVIGDVRQHAALRKRLVELEWLKPARLWTP